jgi:hypothetical protein
MEFWTWNLLGSTLCQFTFSGKSGESLERPVFAVPDVGYDVFIKFWFMAH